MHPHVLCFCILLGRDLPEGQEMVISASAVARIRQSIDGLSSVQGREAYRDVK